MQLSEENEEDMDISCQCQISPAMATTILHQQETTFLSTLSISENREIYT